MAEHDLRISRRTFLAGSGAGVVLAALPGGFMNGAVAAGPADWAVRFSRSLPGNDMAEVESETLLWG